VVIFDKRLGSLEENMNPESQKFIQAVGEAFGAMHQTMMYWPLHKHKKTKAWRKMCETGDIIYECDFHSSE
jgi:hypothetical protein